MGHVNGQQARELIDGTTPGPWLVTHDPRHHPDDCEWAIESNAHHLDSPPSVVDFDGVTQGERDARLIAAAPALAETVAWLYGRESDDVMQDWDRYEVDEADVTYSKGSIELYAATNYGDDPLQLDADEAEDLARALLAAAEKARAQT